MKCPHGSPFSGPEISSLCSVISVYCTLYIIPQWEKSKDLFFNVFYKMLTSYFFHYLLFFLLNVLLILTLKETFHTLLLKISLIHTAEVVCPWSFQKRPLRGGNSSKQIKWNCPENWGKWGTWGEMKKLRQVQGGSRWEEPWKRLSDTLLLLINYA